MQWTVQMMLLWSNSFRASENLGEA